jgi:hypothetical protein
MVLNAISVGLSIPWIIGSEKNRNLYARSAGPLSGRTSTAKWNLELCVNNGVACDIAPLRRGLK